ncbi:RNA polymerase II holoenzyme cyclin-like subunit [Leucoagaricus sp. SymC.cos]|nr:RNA polymerase II holoenzyme cyclin-like subunit [Leucoagaricus sp. SymC.cos]
MAADFWASSHHKRWIVDRATVRRARAVDLLYVDDPVYLEYFAIYFANVITKLGKKLGLRQRVIATATVFFRRFYLKNAYCETDPFLVIAACCYVAAKAEESPIHIKTVISEARSLFSQEMYGVKNFPSDNSKLAEMEFYLVDDLECDLTVFHPYRTLLTLCKKESELDPSATPAEEGEAGEVGSSGFSGLSGAGNLGVGIGADDGPRYWGTGEGKLELSTGALQTAWFIINDTYRSDICLLYPPHLIAISAIYLTFILHNPTRSTITPLLSSSSSSSPLSSSTTPTQSTDEPQKPRRSSRNTSQAHSSSTPSQQSGEKKTQDPITFLSELSVSLPLISTISQEIISLYTLWDRYKEDAHPEAKTSAAHASHTYTTTSIIITPSFLSGLLATMRELRVADVTRGPGVAVNKMLERTQAAG